MAWGGVGGGGGIFKNARGRGNDYLAETRSETNNILVGTFQYAQYELEVLHLIMSIRIILLRIPLKPVLGAVLNLLLGERVLFCSVLKASL